MGRVRSALDPKTGLTIVEIDGETTTCSVCHRLLLKEHGPTCEECRAKMKEQRGEKC